MPVISRFYGIVVFMNYRDHDPPHLHARHQGAEVVLELRSGTVIGDFPPRALRLLLEWADLHAEELEVNWNRAREHRHLLPVEPLR
ncbi:MAG: DUF4160 domain-containing protein [Gemmatimonadota bacterium]|nr:DUF4160 domain-containing protein [Gemmatimonadota bacterium]